MTDTYQEYPKVMVHPAAHRSAPTTLAPVNGRADVQGQPDRYPPVSVNDADQEEYHAAQGYVPAGRGDPSAYVAAMVDPGEPAYVHAEYPKWVKRPGGDVLVNDREEEDALAPVQPAVHEHKPDLSRHKMKGAA